MLEFDDDFHYNSLSKLRFIRFHFHNNKKERKNVSSLMLAARCSSQVVSLHFTIHNTAISCSEKWSFIFGPSISPILLHSRDSHSAHKFFHIKINPNVTSQ